MSTKKDYEAVAKIMRAAARWQNADHKSVIFHEQEWMRLKIATLFADLFETENPRFDRTRFLKACVVSDSNTQ